MCQCGGRCADDDDVRRAGAVSSVRDVVMLQVSASYVYHCFEQDLGIHQGCATLPERIVHDGRALELHRKASRDLPPCDFWRQQGHE